ncbi:6-pyruvoyl trahydropterin synthase family protein [Aquimarina celericrescens]|uniref:6-carboxy-5,6,7,8-tetrahydropterin synthase n=1 Tax=Aquimarina celericrescens TaxID=1964542 RepID=A0ABW5AZN3_9FLAO|nr:6-carboxytetrahydropterin synthase [Aquimarina celericrescens]
MTKTVTQKKTAIVRREHFNAAHRLHNPNWSDEKNKKIFGKCNNPNYHGHNYELEVKIIGYCDPETGYVIDTKILSDTIKEHVTEKFDHKNLNLEVPEFKSLNPTAENIARVIYEILVSKVDSNLEVKITLYETPRNYVEYPF